MAELDHREDTAHAAAVTRPRTGKRIGNIVLLVVLVLVALVLVWVFAAPAADRADPRWITCQAESAAPVTSGAKTRHHSVHVVTSCGTIEVDDGVTAANMAEIARDFHSGDDYEFSVGWLSRVYLHLGVTAVARDWREAR